jgi:hypothetical protein
MRRKKLKRSFLLNINFNTRLITLLPPMAAQHAAQPADRGGGSGPFVFLDVDGVLHPLTAKSLPVGADLDELCARADEQMDDANQRDPRYVTRILPQEFRPECLAELKRLVGGALARIVLSSTWRLQGCDRRAVERRLVAAGVVPPSSCPLACTPSLGAHTGRGARGREIRAWLDRRAASDAAYVVLDDVPNEVLDGGVPRDRLVSVDPRTGLDRARADLALERITK